MFLDADSTIALAYGPAEQGVSFGYTTQRGLHPLIATVLEPNSTPDVLPTRLPEGRANTARGAASFLAESISRVGAPGGTGADPGPPRRRVLQRQGDRRLPPR